MEYRILAIGDVVGESGCKHLCRHLRTVKREKAIDLTIVNGENIAGVGILEEHVNTLYHAGVDIITLGNHAFHKAQIISCLERDPYLLRPANFASHAPGKGYVVWDGGRVQVLVINLIGRCQLDFNADNPFFVAEKLMKQEKATFTLIDFHAEATSEKRALGFYLDGKASAIWGTHTHVPTADEQILPYGTGYITDLGMTGPIHSVLGIRPEQSIEGFLGGVPGRYQTAEGPCAMQGAIFTLDSATGLCTKVERMDVR